VSTQWERVRAFLEEVRQRSESEGGFVTILEVCGFNDWLLKLLTEYGCRETSLVVSFRQACMNRFEGCGIVGCRGRMMWETGDGYQQEAGASRQIGGRATAI